MSDPLIGTVLAGYRIDSVIGYGGMGVVYLAEHLGLRRKVALKLIAPHLSRDVDFQKRFEHEARAAASVDHPNVIPVYDYQQVGGELFMTMRFVDGPDLRSVIKREGPLAPERASDLIAQAAAGLDAAHARGLIHRDVKPANILLEERAGGEHVYVMDFGLAKGASATSLTLSGGFMGTLDYASPEQIAQRPDQPVDHRTDVYSLGCVLFETVVGTPPFRRDTEVAKVYAHLNDPPPSARDAAPHVPEALDAVIAKALAKDPAKRQQSAGELGRAVVQAARPAQEASAPTAVMGSSTGGGGRRSRLRARVALALVLVTGGVAAVALVAGGEEGSSGGEAGGGQSTTAPAARLSAASARAVLDDYEEAYAREDRAILRRLFSSDVRRRNNDRTVRGKRRALAEYDDQFAQLTRPDYRLYYSTRNMRLRGENAVVRAHYDIADGGRCVGSGAIRFSMGTGSTRNAVKIGGIDIRSDSAPACRDLGRS